MNRRALLLVIIGLVAAVAASAVVYYLITNVPQPAPAPVIVQNTPVPQKQVVIAATDISANTPITAAELTSGFYPDDLVPADAITRTQDVLGNSPQSAIFSGQILLRRQFLAAQNGSTLSSIIPPGKVLVAFPSTDMLNATGAVQPGDHVDVMISIPISGTSRLDSGSPTGSQLSSANTLTLVSQTTLQNIEVYSIGQWVPPSQESSTNTNANASANPNTSLKVITFIVDHQEALILKYVKDSGATIDLAVRSSKEDKQVQTDPVNLDYIVDLYTLLGLVPPKPTP